MRNCKKLPLCPTDLIPASCRMDPVLAKAKPISDDGGTSEIQLLEGGQWEKGKGVRGTAL